MVEVPVQAKPQQNQTLETQQEIDALKAVHDFLQEFEVKAKFSASWSQVLSHIASVANSLITKQEISLRSKSVEMASAVKEVISETKQEAGKVIEVVAEEVKSLKKGRK